LVQEPSRYGARFDVCSADELTQLDLARLSSLAGYLCSSVTSDEDRSDGAARSPNDRFHRPFAASKPTPGKANDAP